MGGVQRGDHVLQYVSILFFSFSTLPRFFIFLFPFCSKIFTICLSHPLTFPLCFSLFLFFDSAAFSEAIAFNSDISKWKVSKVSTMANSPFQFFFVHFDDDFSSLPLPPFSSSFFCSSSHFSSLLVIFFLFLTLQLFGELKHSTRTSRNGRCPRCRSWDTVRFNSSMFFSMTISLHNFSPFFFFLFALKY